jgi:SH3-like domain-containing protein
MISNLARLSSAVFVLGCMANSAFATPPESAASVFSAKEGTFRYLARVEKNSVNLRTKPSVNSAKASKMLSQGAELEVQKSSEPNWLEILGPEPYQGLFIRQDMVSLKEEAVAALGVSQKESTETTAVVPLTAPVDQTSVGGFWSKTETRRFRASFMPVLASHGSDIYTGIVNWVPSYVFDDGRARVGLDLGATVLKGRSGSRFFASEYAVRGEYAWTSLWSTEVLVGAQSWFKSSYGTALMLGAGVLYHLPQPVLHCLDRVALDYVPVFQSTTAHEIRIGVGVSI